MATFTRVNNLNKALLDRVHDWTGHAFKGMLANTSPSAANAVKADITEIAAGNGYTAGGVSLTLGTVQSGATASFTIADMATLITAAGGSIGPWRYLAIYNDTAAGKPLMGWIDYGASTTTLSGENVALNVPGVGDVVYTLT